MVCSLERVGEEAGEAAAHLRVSAGAHFLLIVHLCLKFIYALMHLAHLKIEAKDNTCKDELEFKLNCRKIEGCY